MQDDSRLVHNHSGIVRNIHGDNAPCTNFHMIPNLNRTYDFRACSNQHIVSDYGSAAISASDRNLMIQRTVFSNHSLIAYNDAIQPMW